MENDHLSLDPLMRSDSDLVVKASELEALHARIQALQTEVEQLSRYRMDCVRMHTPDTFERLHSTVRRQQRELETLRSHVRGLHNTGDVSDVDEDDDEWRETLVSGMFVDAVDEANEWLVAVIVEVQRDEVLVEFFGWGDKYNKWFERNSPQLAPFRSKTLGDTSPGHIIEKQVYTGATNAEQLKLVRTENSHLRLECEVWKYVVESSCGPDMHESAAVFRLYERLLGLRPEMQRHESGIGNFAELRKQLVSIENDASTMVAAVSHGTHHHLTVCQEVCRKQLATVDKTFNQPREIQPTADILGQLRQNFGLFDLLPECSVFRAVGAGMVAYEGRALSLEDNLAVLQASDKQVVEEKSREMCVQHMRKHYDEYAGELVKLISDAVNSDADSYIKTKLKQAYPLHPLKHVNDDRAKDIYCEGIETGNISGGALEIRVLSECLRVAIDVYHANSPPSISSPVGNRVALYEHEPGHFFIILERGQMSQLQERMANVMSRREERRHGSLDRKPLLRSQRSVSPSGERIPRLMKDRTRYTHSSDDDDDDEYSSRFGSVSEVNDTKMETEKQATVREVAMVDAPRFRKSFELADSAKVVSKNDASK